MHSQISTIKNVPPSVSANANREHVPCNLCGSENRLPFRPETGLGMVQCTDCGLVYISPRPAAEELYTLYGETYFRNDESSVVGYTDYLADESNIRKTSQRRMKHIEKFIQPPGRMLDVGCATGFFIVEAHNRGWKVEGLDVSAFAVQYTDERFGFKTYHGSLMEAELRQGDYDVVTMWDVIEHVPDPKTSIQIVADLLRPGGIFELSTPDIASIPAKLTGKRWIGYKLADEHIYYFSVRTLSQMLNEAGFDVLHVRHIGKYVTLRLFLDRLGFYVPWLSKPLELLERTLKLSQRSFYINPFDIVAITARKR